MPPHNEIQPQNGPSGALPPGAYVTPPPGTVGPHGFLLKHGTAVDPIDAYRPEPGETGILVEVSYFRWWIAADAYASARPRIFVDGTEVPNVAWGQSHIPTTPGLHHVEVSTGKPKWWYEWIFQAWVRDMGYADTVVPVAEGHFTPVHYRSPAQYVLRGAIGPQPMRWPGLNWIRFSWVITAAFVGLVLVAIVLNILD
ncbi:hypothetical protein [Nocardia lijiangensis]|uniref:hypothetical protein n=1 Tax=Nocardia lijiangensis TaxID=299618 RepID=UPI003D703E5F